MLIKLNSTYPKGGLDLKRKHRMVSLLTSAAMLWVMQPSGIVTVSADMAGEFSENHSYVGGTVNTPILRSTDIQPIEITEHPSAVSDVYYNENVTLTAKADNANTARWYCRSLNGIQPCGKLTALDESGLTSVSVKADGKTYFCRFSDGKEYADTQTVSACFIPAFKVNETSMTFILGEDAEISIPCDYDHEHPCDHIITDEWIMRKNGTDVTITSSDKYIIKGSRLTIKDISSEESSCILRHIITEHGSYYSKGINISVVDGEPDKSISSFELEGIGKLFIGDKAPGISDISTMSEKYTIESISWIGVDANGYIVSPNPAYSISLKAADGYMFRYGGNGDIKGHMDDIMLTAYGVPDTYTDKLTVSRTYDNHTYLTAPKDFIALEQYDLSACRYNYVDIQLKVNFSCPDQHSEKHVIKSFTDAHYSAGYHLPEGLTMDSMGHITGMLTAPEGVQPFLVYIESTSGEAYLMDCTFSVNEHEHQYVKDTDPETGEAVMVCSGTEYCGAEPIPVPQEPHNAHTWGQWISDNDNTHSCTCTECSEIKTESHNFDDGVITKEASKEEKGIIVYTCTECGHQITKEYEYDGNTDDDYILGDANGDGMINVSDIALAAAYVKGRKPLDDKSQKRADTNNDGKVNISDISKIAAHVKGKKLLAK